MKILSLLMLSSLICFSAQAFEGKLVSFTLENGKKISALKDIKEVFRGPQNQIDLIELKNGEIFYDTEIRETSIQLGNLSQIKLPIDNIRLGDGVNMVRMVGGDGSGGG